MAEFDEKLNALLSNPESMAQIMQLAQTLSGQSGAQPQQQPQQQQQSSPPPQQPQQQPQQQQQPSPPPQQPFPMQNAPPAGKTDTLSSLMGGLDPKLLTRLIPVIQELNNNRDSNAGRLLYALRPYLKPERQEKVERALQLARLIHIGKKFLTGWEG